MCTICNLERWIFVYGGSVSVSERFLFLKSLFLLLLTKAQKSYAANDAEIIPLSPFSLNCYVHTLDEVSEWRV